MTGRNWGSQPGFTNLDANPNVAAGYNGSCPAAWIGMDLSNLVADWYYGKQAGEINRTKRTGL